MALTKVTSNVLADNAVTTGKILDNAAHLIQETPG